jgi:aspartate/methionine/tyrosine aminotransferase
MENKSMINAELRRTIRDMPRQLIGEVSRLGLGQPDTIPLWYGESDVPTPRFICDAAHQAMVAGRTFYTHKRGLPELRMALAEYMAELYGAEIDMERVTVTMSGMAAIMLSMQAILEAGDNTVNVTPVWPNCVYAAAVRGAEPRRVPLALENGVWRLDLDRLFDACDARTRILFVNSPGNPTGWMMERAEQQAILDFARARGIWIIADEVYARIVYDRPVAPSFLEIAGPEDPVLVVNSFSKSWAMTGWRIGWLTHPERIRENVSSLIEYSTAAVPEFTQLAGLAAVSQGEPFVAEMRERCRRGRDAVVPRLKDMPRVTLDPPRAAFYAFFKVAGVDDSLEFAKRLFRETKVGVAPGAAFGPEGEGWLRLCFASDPQRLTAAMDRLEAFLG